MNGFTHTIVFGLARTSLLLAVTFVVVAFAVRKQRIAFPAWEPLLWALVLVQGWSWIGLSVPIPWSWTASRPAAPPTSSLSGTLPNAADSAHTFAKALRSRPAAGRTVPAESAWVFWPAAFWIAGVIGIPAAAIVRRVRFSLRPLPNYDGAGAWNEELQACRRQFKVRAPIELCVTADLGPLLYWGAGGYRVVVPEPLWRQLTLPQRLAVLRHEVCHAAHRDVWRLLLVRLLALPHWFNPLAWSAVRRFEECLEARCDDAARPPGRPSTMPRRYCCWPR